MTAVAYIALGILVFGLGYWRGYTLASQQQDEKLGKAYNNGREAERRDLDKARKFLGL